MGCNWKACVIRRITAAKRLGFTSPRLPLATSFSHRTLGAMPVIRRWADENEDEQHRYPYRRAGEVLWP